MQYYCSTVKYQTLLPTPTFNGLKTFSATSRAKSVYLNRSQLHKVIVEVSAFLQLGELGGPVIDLGELLHLDDTSPAAPRIPLSHHHTLLWAVLDRQDPVL